MATVSLNLSLPQRTPPQRQIQKSKARFKVGVWGRQSGKTTNGTWTMFTRPIEGRMNGMYWYILQTHSAAEVAFNRYVKLFPKQTWPYLWAKRPNESEKTVFLTGGRQVQFKSGQNFDDLRIETLDGCIIDECRQQDKRLWTQVIRPMLGRRKGWCDFYSTPNGYDWFYDLAQDAKILDDWDVIHAPSWSAWWWTPEEIDSAKSTMSQPEFDQEIGAEFRDLTSGRAYMLFSDKNKSPHCPFAEGKQWTPWHPIILGLDFNLSPMAWTLGQELSDQWWWFDEIHLLNSHTMEASLALRDRILMMKEEGFRGEPNLILCGDATGKATQRSSNQSDYDIVKQVLKDAHISFRDETPEANPSVRDRVNAVNGRCMNAKGEVNLWVGPECKMLIHDLERVTWKPGADFVLNPGTDKTLTHNTDSIGYPIQLRSPVKVVKNIGKNRIIQRTL